LSALGLHIGSDPHILAAAFGLAVVLEAVPVLCTIVKFVGAGYLVWLAFRLVFPGRASAGPAAAGEAPPRGRTLRQSITVEVLNPETALFYLAFLPQFTGISAALPLWGQVLVLGAIVNLLFSATDAACILLSVAVSTRLSASQSVNRLARRIGGSVLVALGVKLAASRP